MTKIEWVKNNDGTSGKTWNPITGCTPISPGCAHCYARRMAKRLAGRCGYPASPHEFDVTFHHQKLYIPTTWIKPATVFVCSMSDLFHQDVPVDVIRRVWGVMRQCQRHTFIVLTKRAQRMAEVLTEMYAADCSAPLPNVIGMVTAENQEQADARVPWLLRAPFATRGVSLEPLLGKVHLDEYKWLPFRRSSGLLINQDAVGYAVQRIANPRLDWVIVGGETGPGARPMHPRWVYKLRDQCRAAEVPFFFKSWGEWLPNSDYDYDLSKSFEEQDIPYQRAHVWLDGTLAQRGERRPDELPLLVYKTGRKRAGRLIDGRAWEEFPQERYNENA